MVIKASILVSIDLCKHEDAHISIKRIFTKDLRLHVSKVQLIQEQGDGLEGGFGLVFIH